MKTMTSCERVLTALTRGIPDKVPFLDAMDPGMKEKILGGKQAPGPEQDLALARTMRFDAIQCEGLYPPFFAETVPGGSARDIVVRGLIRERKDLSLVRFPRLDEAFFEPVKRFLDVTGACPMARYFRTRMGCAGVLNSMGLEGFSYALEDDPGLVENLMDRYAEWAMELLDKVQAWGFDFAWFADDIAYKTGPMMSPQVFREIFLPRMRRVADRVRLPWVYHSDGNLMPVMEDLLSLGMNGLNPIEPGAMDILEMKRLYGHRVCLIGNIDLRYTLTLGTTAEVEEEVRERIRTIGPGGGYIISSANSLTSYCKPENVLAFRDAVLKYREIG